MYARGSFGMYASEVRREGQLSKRAAKAQATETEPEGSC
jgi:hypothetical protein